MFYFYFPGLEPNKLWHIDHWYNIKSSYHKAIYFQIQLNANCRFLRILFSPLKSI